MTALDPNHKAFDSYRRRLKGEKLPMRESEPEAGFYRYKTRNIDTAVVVMPTSNDEPWDLICLVGKEQRQFNALEIWTYIVGKHVTPQAAQVVWETGKWPEAAPEALVNPPEVASEVAPAEQAPPEDVGSPPEARGSVMGDNAEKAGVGPIEEAKSYLEVAMAFFTGLKGKITTKLDADKAANCRDRLAMYSGDSGILKKAHTEEKAPYLAKCREIDDKYLRLIETLKKMQTDIGVPLKVYLDGEAAKVRAAAEAERKRQEEEAAKKRQAAIEEARKRQDEEAAKQIEAIPVAALIEAPAPAPVKVAVGGQASGRRTTLKKETIYTITDYDKVLQAVKDQADVREAVEKAAKRLAKAGMTIEGLTKSEGTKL